MHNSTQSSVTEQNCQWCYDHSHHFTSTEKQTQTHDETTSTAQPNVQSHRHELLSSIQPTSPHRTLLLPPTWLTLTLCPTTQHRRLADWSRDRQAGAAHVTSGSCKAEGRDMRTAPTLLSMIWYTLPVHTAATALCHLPSYKNCCSEQTVIFSYANPTTCSFWC